MRAKVAKQLRKKAFDIAEQKISEKDNTVHRRKIRHETGIKESIINLITERYKADTPVAVYRKLKKRWNATPRNMRNIEKAMP